MFIDSADGKIEWRSEKALVEYEKKNDFGLTHKPTNRHINFGNGKMHVRTAIQTINNSAANSLEFWMARYLRGFSNAGATIIFDRFLLFRT